MKPLAGVGTRGGDATPKSNLGSNLGGFTLGKTTKIQFSVLELFQALLVELAWSGMRKRYSFKRKRGKRSRDSSKR